MFPFDIHLSISKSKSVFVSNLILEFQNVHLYCSTFNPFLGRYKRLSGKHRKKIINSCFANNNFNYSVAFIKYKHNIVIPKEHGLVTNRQNHYSFTKHTQFPINLWPTSRTKHVTIIPILISNEFASVYISELENTINSLTSQAGCVEFLPISPAEVRSFTNWIRIEPGKKMNPFD